MDTKHRCLVFELLEYRRLLTSITQIRYFDTWDAGIIRSTDVAGITFHPPSGHLFLSDSEINELSEFNGDNMFEVSLLGAAVFDEIESGNREPTGITYNQYDGYFYVVNDTGDKLVTRYDANLNNPLLEVSTTDAVSSATDPEGITSDPSTGFLYVADGANGDLQVLAYNSSLDFQYSFSVASRMADAEGIAYHAPTNHLFIVDGKDDHILEYTLTGGFVEEYDISDLSPAPKAPQGLTWGPTSNPNDAPSALSIYIADGMKDNHPDGRVYEAIIWAQGNSPPTTSGIANVNVNVDAPDTVVNLFTAFDDFEDPDEDLTYTIETNTNSSLFTATTVDGVLGTLTLDYAPATTGTADITMRATDTGSPSLFVETTFAVSVTLPNQQPTTSGIADVVVSEDSPDTPISLFAAFEDAEDADNELTYTIESNSKPSLFTTTTIDGATGMLTLDYAPDAIGAANIRVRATDTGFPVLFVETTFTATVTEVNDQPVHMSGTAADLTVTQNSGTTPLGFAGLGYGPGGGSDEDGQTLSYAVTSVPSPSLGQILLAGGSPVAPGAYTLAQIQGMQFQAAPGVVGGPETFAFTVTDNGTTNGSNDFKTLTQSLQVSIAAEMLDIRVAASSDDAEERPNGVVKLTSGDLELIQDNAHQQTVGIRFNNIGILPFSIIQNAYIQFQVDEVSTDPTSLTIQGEASDNALTFTSASGNVSSRTRTNASVSWDPAPWPTKWDAGPAQQTANLTSIIQEIVNRPGWSSGNALAVIITGTGKRVADSYDGDAGGAPLLHIDYLESTNNPPVAVNDSFNTDEESAINENVLAANPTSPDSDPDGDLLSVTHVNGNQASVGQQIQLSSGAKVTLAANGNLQYDPDGQFESLAAGEQATDQFTYTINDGNGGTDIGVVTVTLAGVNDLPQANDDGGAGFTTDKSTPFVTGNVFSNDTDPDVSDTLTLQSFNTSLTLGLVTSNGDGTFNYNPNGQFDGLGAGQSATDTFTYVARDPSGATDTATVTITVTAGNQSPQIANQSFQVDENSAVDTVVGTVVASDPDAVQSLSFQITLGNVGGAFAIHPTSGVITVANSGPLDFETTPTFALTVQVTDNGSPVLTNSATVTVNLNNLEKTSGGQLDVRVAASSDDAEERTSGLVKLTSSDLELTFDRTEQIVGMRFNSVTVPPGAIIGNAYIQFQVDEVSTNATSLTIQAESVDNALTFTSTRGSISARPKTTASVAWTPAPWSAKGVAGPDQQTPNISAVIQEIVSRPGWSSGNSIVALITGTGERVAESYDGDVNGAPLLHVEYTMVLPLVAGRAAVPSASKPATQTAGRSVATSMEGLAMALTPSDLNETRDAHVISTALSPKLPSTLAVYSRYVIAAHQPPVMRPLSSVAPEYPDAVAGTSRAAQTVVHDRVDLNLLQSAELSPVSSDLDPKHVADFWNELD